MPAVSSRATIATLVLASLLTQAEPARGVPEEIPVPSGGDELLAFGVDSDLDLAIRQVEAKGAWVAVDGMPFENAFRIDADTRFSTPSNLRLTVPLTGPIAEGDTVLLSMWVRRPGSGGQPSKAYLRVEEKGDNDTEEGAKDRTEQPVLRYAFSGYKQWQQIVRPFVATRATRSPPRVVLDLGESGRVIELANLRLINYAASRDAASLPRSTINYRGREPGAEWRQAAQRRIEQLRKADLTVEVVDADGSPCPEAEVRVVMQRHAFGFGCAVNSELLGAGEQDFPRRVKRNKAVTWADAQQYRRVVRDYFDRVTFESELRPHVWKALKGPQGWNRRGQILMQRALPWLAEQGIAVRGHYIAWAPMNFNKLEEQFLGNPEGHRAWLWDHMADVLPATAEFVTEWDTINHIVGWGKHTYEQEYGGPEIYAQILAEARRLAPDATHAINEGKVLPDGYKREPYLKIIRFLSEQGQAPDTVGFMAHFGLTTLTPPEELLAVYDNFAEAAPSLQLSEFDVDAGDDEQLQADYFRDVMIASFSHPAFTSISQWGFWEPLHWKPTAALWRKDWSLKPAGEVFVDLVTNRWWTDEQLTTDSDGWCAARGFHGEYRVEATSGGREGSATVSLEPAGAVVRVMLE